MKVGLGVSPAILRVFANLLFLCPCVEPRVVEGSNDHYPEAKIVHKAWEALAAALGKGGR